MNFTKSYVLSCLGALGMLAVGQTAQALDLNGKGSSAGRNFAGQVTGAVCAPGSPATYYFTGTAAGTDPSLPSTRSEWRCTVSGAPGVSVFRYHGTNSLDGFSSLNNTSVQRNTQGYIDTQNAGSGCVPSTFGGLANPRAFAGHPNVTLMACSSAAPLLTTLPIHYGASDVQGSSFTQSAFGASVKPPVLASGVDLTTLPINTVPFAVAVGAGVLKSTGPNVQVDNLSVHDLYQILSGTVTNWTRLGLQTDTGGQTAITVCQRTVGSGTLATIDQTIMKKGPISINPTRVPASGAPALGSPGNLNNPSSGDVLNCLNNVGGVNPNHRMSIGYIDSDSAGSLTTGAHFVKINGYQAFDPALPATSARLKDLRCGDYSYWANWNVVVRTNGVDGVPITGGGNVPAGTQNLLDAYVTAALSNNPLPGFWATQADMFVVKNEDQGPHAMIPGGETFCRP